MYSGITSGRVLDGELLYTTILEVNLFAFAFRLFHEDFSSINGAFAYRLSEHTDKTLSHIHKVHTRQTISANDLTAMKLICLDCVMNAASRSANTLVSNLYVVGTVCLLNDSPQLTATCSY